MTAPVILACIPVENPWEIYAYLPFGGWNECPDTLELMAVSKYWYETYGAVPAALSHDQLEFYTQETVEREAAKDLALEQYAFCPDRVDQCGEDCSIGELADCLSKSTIWYFGGINLEGQIRADIHMEWKFCFDVRCTAGKWKDLKIQYPEG